MSESRASRSPPRQRPNSWVTGVDEFPCTGIAAHALGKRFIDEAYPFPRKVSIILKTGMLGDALGGEPPGVGEMRVSRTVENRAGGENSENSLMPSDPILTRFPPL